MRLCAGPASAAEMEERSTVHCVLLPHSSPVGWPVDTEEVLTLKTGGLLPHASWHHWPVGQLSGGRPGTGQCCASVTAGSEVGSWKTRQLSWDLVPGIPAPKGAEVELRV